MSAGSFVIAGYETDDGDTRPIRVQPETVAAWNPEQPGTVAGNLVRVSGGNRKYGLKARRVTLKRNLGPVVEGVQPTKTITLPVMQTATFNSLAIGSPVTYAGVAWVVAGRSGQAGR